MEKLLIICINCKEKYSLERSLIEGKTKFQCSTCKHIWPIETKNTLNYENSEVFKKSEINFEIPKAEAQTKKAKFFSLSFTALVTVAILGNVVIWFLYFSDLFAK